jgi:hypothetical protein
LIRELADYVPGADYERYEAVKQWPLSEALISYKQRLRQQRLVEYRHQGLIYVLGGLKHKPKRPKILDED